MANDKLDRWAEEAQAEVLEEARLTHSEAALAHWTDPHNFIDPPPGSRVGKVRGPCGDTILIWLLVGDGRIQRAGFTTDGCGSSIMCGSAAVTLAEGHSIRHTRSIDQARILEALGGLPELEQHCALLAARVLARALDAAEPHE